MSSEKLTAFATRLPTKLHSKLKAYSRKNSLSMNQALVKSLADLVNAPDRVHELELSLERIEKKVDKLLNE